MKRKKACRAGTPLFRIALRFGQPETYLVVVVLGALESVGVVVDEAVVVVLVEVPAFLSQPAINEARLQTTNNAQIFFIVAPFPGDSFPRNRN
jgi:hypothetical protein